MTTVAITLNDEHEQYIREAVNTGAFASKSEVVATALELLKLRDDLRRTRRAQLKRAVEEGVADLDRAGTADFELSAFLASMRSKHENSAP